MTRGKAFIFFAEDWGRHPTSTQHLIKGFLGENKCFWVNSISVRAPKLSLYDLNRLLAKLKNWKMQPQQNKFSNFKILSPLIVPFYSIKPIRKINKILLCQQIKKRLREFSNKRPILWLSIPTAVDMLGKLDEALSIYYCGDEFSEFPGVSKKAIIEMEKKLLLKVDLVLVSSRKLYETKKKYNKNTFIITHGVDFEHFNKENYVNSPIPEKLAKIKRPIIGYYGLIADWVDIEPFEYVAKNKPEWSVVLIGKSMLDLSFLKKYSNVHLLGPINYQKLPQYSVNFDVALMPFKTSELTSFVNPLKMLEFMASGLPIVATYLPELDKYSKIIKLATSKEEFLEKISECLEEKGKIYIQQGVNIAKEETWHKKTQEISSLIEKILVEKGLK